MCQEDKHGFLSKGEDIHSRSASSSSVTFSSLWPPLHKDFTTCSKLHRSDDATHSDPHNYYNEVRRNSLPNGGDGNSKNLIVQEAPRREWWKYKLLETLNSDLVGPAGPLTPSKEEKQGCGSRLAAFMAEHFRRLECLSSSFHGLQEKELRPSFGPALQVYIHVGSLETALLLPPCLSPLSLSRLASVSFCLPCVFI